LPIHLFIFLTSWRGSPILIFSFFFHDVWQWEKPEELIAAEQHERQIPIAAVTVSWAHCLQEVKIVARVCYLLMTWSVSDFLVLCVRYSENSICTFHFVVVGSCTHVSLKETWLSIRVGIPCMYQKLMYQSCFVNFTATIFWICCWITASSPGSYIAFTCNLKFCCSLFILLQHLIMHAVVPLGIELQSATIQ